MKAKKLTRPVYFVAGGISKFAKVRTDATFQLLVKEAVDLLVEDLAIPYPRFLELVDATVASYFSDHFTRQLKAGSMVQDYLGLCPKRSERIEGGGATGGLCFQAAVERVASGVSDVCLAYGFETMSHVHTWKGNEFIALASDVNYDFPVGGFYTGFYALMARRHMHEFGTSVEDLAKVSVKNHRNAAFNPYAQKHNSSLTVQDVRQSEMVSSPLTRLDICTMSDGAATCLVVSEDGLEELRQAGVAADVLSPRVRIAGIGAGLDTMRLTDRPHHRLPEFLAAYSLPTERARPQVVAHYQAVAMGGFCYPGIHSFRAGRVASKSAYEMAEITDPLQELDVIELHDAYTSSEIQTCEDLGLCAYGEGGQFVSAGLPFLPTVNYGLNFSSPEKLLLGKRHVAINPSGGLIACGHPVGATGLMQAVFVLWQLTEKIRAHFSNSTPQVQGARTGAWHSHAGTGSYVTVSIGRKEE